MRNYGYVSNITQGAIIKGENVSQSTGRGERIAQARRLLGVALHQDMPRKAVAELLGVSGPTWTRWEAEDDRPTYENLQLFARLCQEHGLTGVTAAWLEFGEGEGPPFTGHNGRREGRGAREGLRGERLARPSALKKKRGSG